MTLNSQDLLESLYKDLISNFQAKLKDKTASAADLSVIRQFLKDNNITSMPTKDNELGGLLDAIDPEEMNALDLVEDFQSRIGR